MAFRRCKVLHRCTHVKQGERREREREREREVEVEREREKERARKIKRRKDLWMCVVVLCELNPPVVWCA